MPCAFNLPVGQGVPMRRAFVISFLVNHKSNSAERRCFPDDNQGLVSERSARLMPSSKKSAAGCGTIRKKTIKRNGKDYTYWEARYTVGYDPGTGKQIQKSITEKHKAKWQ